MSHETSGESSSKRNRYAHYKPADGKVRIIDRQNIDNRTHIARKFDDMVSAIRSDLGGSDLTTLQLSLIEAYVGAAVSLNDMNANRILGNQVDIVEYATTGSLMVRIASRLGLERRARDVTDLSLRQVLDALQTKQSEEDVIDAEEVE